MEDYTFEIREEKTDQRVFVLVIYDIIDNKKRVKLSKYLQGYGFRIQKSAFEAMINEKVYHKMLCGLERFATDDDSIRVYKMIGRGQVINFGAKNDVDQDEVVIV